MNYILQLAYDKWKDKKLNARSAIHLLIPRFIRIELLRLKRRIAWILETNSTACSRLPESERRSYKFLLDTHESAPARVSGQVPAALQSGKERNVQIASQRIDGILIRPHEIFSYHRTVGRPSRLRGFRNGMELHEGVLTKGVGGGCCQVSNLLYLLAIRSGMKIVERHRHGIDIFPDHGRTVPFGCGATVFYNYFDLRFENPLPVPVLLRFKIKNAVLVGEIWTSHDPGWTVNIYESEHERYRFNNEWIRENRIRRRFVRKDGQILLVQEMAHNRGRILYDIPDEDEPQQESENRV